MHPKVVLCGTFHRDPDGLSRHFKALEDAGCRILSPISINFIDRSQEIVRTATETDMSIFTLELMHLRAIRDADFVWLHTPDGHAGLSTAYEMGYATAYRKPIFTDTPLRDEMLASQVVVIGSVQDVLLKLGFSRLQVA